MKTTLHKLLGLKFLSMCIMALLLSFSANAQQPAANLSQGSNGNYTSPLDPVAWVNGNLNAQQAHMVEGYSVPYRVVMTNLVVGVPIEIEIQYDTRHSSRHALDFITHYQNLEPHFIWGHPSETVDPLIGYPAVPNTPVYATIPPPTQGKLVNGVMEPQATFNSLSANLKRMTLFGGVFAAINPVSYSAEDPIGLGAPAQTATTVMIKFTPTGSTAILAWGGHIATSLTFGDGQAAGGINGSPYHTRLIDWNLNNLGNQDRSLSAASIVQIPECDFSFTPSSPLCINTPMIFTIDNPIVNSTYAWSVTNNGTNASPVNGSGTTFNVNSGTMAGSFTVEVTASVIFAGNPLTVTCSTIVDVNQISLSYTKVDVDCYGENTGSIDLTVIGGSAPYTYAWVAASGGVVPVGQSGLQDLSGLVAGTYNVTVTDASGCQAMTSVVITQPAAALATSATKVDVLCYGLATGSIDLSVTGGTAPYSYAWSGSLGGIVPVGQAGLQDLSGLVAGTYSVVVTDANGCVANRSVVITQPAAALATSATKVDVLCYGLATGSIDLSVSGGTAPYSYAWSGSLGGVVPVGQAGLQDLSGLVAGTYSVVVTDANGCVANRSVVITQPAAALATSATKVDVLCYGLATGSIDLSVTGGTAPYSYAWSGSLGGVVPVGQAGLQDLSGLVAGTYSVVVTDANGCVANRSVVITQPAAALATSATKVDVLCYGLATGSIDLSVSGGTAPYSYAWSGSLGGVVPVGQAGLQDLSGLVAGTYSVVVTDANGCVANRSVVITQPAAALATSATKVDVLCYGLATGSIDLSVTGGTAPYSYAWSGSLGGVVPVGQAGLQDLSGLVAGTYSVVVTDANGCVANRSVVITQPAAALACSIDEPSGPVLCDTPGYMLSAVANGGTAPYSYSWSVSNPAWVITGGQGTASVEYTPGGGIDNITFFILTVTDANGCVSVCSLEVACTTPDPEPEFEYCTKSQGFYGNLGGVHCDNRTTLQLVDDLLIANGGMVLGVPANNKTFTIGSGDASCLISILPGGGPAAVLPGVNDCGNFGNLLSKQGKSGTSC
jgi:hypothetical protein